MSDIIPSIGVSGLFTLKTPFDTLLTPAVAYTCIEIRRLEGIVADGGSPFEDYYVPKAIDQATYNTDVANGVCILGLQTLSGDVQYVPTSYVLGYPDSGGVPYTVVMLGVNLGAIPDDMRLDVIIQAVHDTIVEKTGILADIRQTVASERETRSQDDHDVIEAARLARITDTTTDHAKYLAAQAQVTKLQAQVTVLEQFIVANPPPPPGP